MCEETGLTMLLLEEVRGKLAEAPVEFLPLQGGSVSRTFLAGSENRKLYAVKIQRYHALLEKRDALRRELDRKDTCHQPLCLAFRSEAAPEAYITVSGWVEGRSPDLLHEIMPEERLIKYAKAAAEVTKGMHRIDCSLRNVVSDDREDLQKAIEFIAGKQIVFPYQKEITAEAERLSQFAVHSPYGFVHMDLHPENMIFSDRGCSLVDMETLSYGAVWRDLIYAVELNFPHERHFWKLFLREYFQGEIPAEFWEEMLRYVLIAFLMLMKPNWNNGTMERQYELAKKIYWDYEGFTRQIPVWMEREA